jgi:hypothetical protein
MISVSLTQDQLADFTEIYPTAKRQVIGPPDGDLLNPKIRAIDVVTVFDPDDGPCINTFWKPEKEDIECLQRGGIIQFTWMGDHLHPISSQIWGA